MVWTGLDIRQGLEEGWIKVCAARCEKCGLGKRIEVKVG